MYRQRYRGFESHPLRGRGFLAGLLRPPIPRRLQLNSHESPRYAARMATTKRLMDGHRALIRDPFKYFETPPELVKVTEIALLRVGITTPVEVSPGIAEVAGGQPG